MINTADLRVLADFLDEHPTVAEHITLPYILVHARTGTNWHALTTELDTALPDLGWRRDFDRYAVAAYPVDGIRLDVIVEARHVILPGPIGPAHNLPVPVAA